MCLVSYVLPVIIHLYIFCRPGGKAQQLGGLDWLRRLFPAPGPASLGPYEPLTNGVAHTHATNSGAAHSHAPDSDPGSVIIHAASYTGQPLRSSTAEAPRDGSRADADRKGAAHVPGDSEADGAERGVDAFGATGGRGADDEATGHEEGDDGDLRVPLLQSSTKGQGIVGGDVVTPNGHVRGRSTDKREGCTTSGRGGSRVWTCASVGYFWEVFREVVVPVGVAVLGVGFSIGGIWVALHNLMVSMANRAAELGSWLSAS